MPKIVSEKDILKLHRKGKVSTEAGEKIKRVAKIPKAELSTEEQQTKAIKQTAQAVTLLIDKSEKNTEVANNNALILLEVIDKISKIKQQEIKTPDQPKRFKELVVTRDEKGFTKKLIPIWEE